MTFYLDSASPDDAREAAELGFIVGATTNPKLLSRVDRPAAQVLRELCDVLQEGTVFYQLTAPTVAEREAEAYRVADLCPGRIGIKVPCTTTNLVMLPRLAEAGLICAVTAIFSAHQALLAAEVGADYVIPYVNRTTRQMGDGIALVREMATVFERTGASTEILAASFYNLTEVAQAVQAGADHVSISLDLLKALGDHPLSDRAIQGFAEFT